MNIRKRPPNGSHRQREITIAERLTKWWYFSVLGLNPKDLVGIPWMAALAHRADGWFLRDDIIWYMTTARSESMTDRTAKAHEYLFMFSKSERYYYDADAIAEFAKGKGVYRYVRSVWSIPTSRYKGAHDATGVGREVHPRREFCQRSRD